MGNTGKRCDRTAEAAADDSPAFQGEGREYLDLILGSVSVGVITSDEQGAIQIFNPAAERIFGYAAAEVVGRNVAMLMPPDQRRMHDRAVHEYLHSGERKILDIGAREVTGQTKDRKPVPLELSASEGFLHGRRIFIGILRDISGRRKSEAVLRAAREEAELANRAESRFFANMSHELRTPLNAIIGFCGMLLSGVVGELAGKQTEYIADVESSGRVLLSLIDDLLELSTAELGGLELHEQPVDMADTIDTCVQLMQGRANAAGVSLENKTGAEAPPIRADSRRVRQILFNLISNALKCAESGGSVSVRGWRGADGGFAITVSDTGVGFAEHHGNKLGEPFYKVETGLYRHHPGAGLGLALTRKFMKLHDGDLKLDSVPGRGAKATVLFPASRVIDSTVPV